LLTWVASIAAALTLIAGFGIWRLMQGPIELDYLAPYVQAGFERAGLGLRITMSGVRLGIDRTTHQLDLWVEDVHLSLPDGERLANFPEMAASFSLGSLLSGRLAPTRLVIERPVVRLRRDEAGAITLRIGDQAPEAANSGLGLVAALAGPPQPNAPLGSLRRLRVRNATVIVDDRLLGRQWQADHLDATLERGARGIDGDLSFAITMGSTTSELHASYRYDTARRKIDLDLSADGVEPAVLAPLFPALEPLIAIHFPVSGTIASQFDLDEQKFEGLRVDLDFGGGWLQSDEFRDGRLAVTKGELHAVYAPDESSLRLDRLALDLGDGMRLAIDGRVDGITRGLVATGVTKAESLPGRVGIVVSNVPIGKIDGVWPRAFSPGGKRWVLANIRDGVLDEAAAELTLKIDPATRTAKIVESRGLLRYHDLAINYFTGLPLALNVSGTATITDKQLDFVPTGGTLKSLKLTGGLLRITDFGAPVETLTIDLNLAGPLQDALEVIDSKPLQYARAAGFDPASVGGRSETQLHFKLPLVDNLKIEAVEYAAKANLSGVSFAKVALDSNLSDGNFALDLTRTGVRLKGEGRFDGLPTAIDATMFFKIRNGVRATYRVGLTLDDEARRRLDYDPAPDRLSGPVAIDLTYSAIEGNRATAVAALDLRGTSLQVVEAGWGKLPGLPGTARIAFDLDRDAVTRVQQIEVKAAGLDGNFAIGFSADRRRVERVDIKRLVVGGNDFVGTVTRRASGGWQADLRGARLDLRPLFKHVLADTGGAPPPLAITARLDRVDLGPRRELRAVSAELLRDGGMWQTARIDARYVNGKQLAVRLGGEAGPRRLSVTSDDLGATLSLLDIADNVVGGRLSVTGQLGAAAGKPVLHARVVGSDYTLVRASAVTKVLSLASLDGLMGMMSGSGIPFSTLRGDFTYRDGGIVLDRMVAYGGALGLTASGSIDLDRDTLDISGTIAPAHTLNSVLGNVPVLGSLLMGGEDQSLFAANYRVSGPVADPSVSVNPLSVLAPGFLRRIFDIDLAPAAVPRQPFVDEAR